MRLLLSILWLYWLPVALHGQSAIEVCPTCPLPTVQAGIDAAQPFDTVWIRPGTYLEYGITIDKPLTLIGIDFPVIDGMEQGEILTVRSDSVHIHGLEVRNVGVSYIEDRAGIYLEQVNHCTITDNRLVNAFFGIYLEYVEHVRLVGNHIEGQAEEEVNSANAIHLWRCKKVHIEGNTATGHRDGIYLEFVDSTLVVDNEVYGNLRYGLHFMFSNDDTYLNNLFRDNGVGVAVMYSDRIIMQDNQFLDNWSPISYGLLLKEIRYSTIRHNLFQKNTAAIYAESVIDTEISENDLVSNGWAVELLGSCENVTFTRNNFRGNSFEVATNAGRQSNRFYRNYWSGYTGYDLDRDGFGDISYRPVKLFAYLAQEIPTSIMLLRSPFMNVLNHAEQVMPILTPETLIDPQPYMNPIAW